MSKSEQADVPSRRAGNARQYAKQLKARGKRRVWKNAIRAGKDFPKEDYAQDGKYRGYIS